MSKQLFQWVVVACLVVIIVLLAVPLVARPATSYKSVMASPTSINESLNVYYAAGWQVDGLSYLSDVNMVYVILHK